MPLNKDELNDLGIRQWADVRKNFEFPDILFGNGFSIRQSDKFTYRSLFEVFIQNCPANLRGSFRLFDTANFELILEYLSYAKKVIESLKLDATPIINLIERLKNGLVDAIRRIHPTAVDINWDRLDSITADLDSFNDIFTTNYDLYLYHMIMKAKDRYELEQLKGDKADPRVRPYNDYFWGSKNAPPGYLEFVDYQHYNQYKHIYYLHGALFIFPYDLLNIKIKSKARSELITVIEEEITRDRFPVFVSEGTAPDKVASIYRSPYLRFCLEKLSQAQQPLLIFGNSLGDVDTHIVNAITKRSRKIVYAIYINGRTPASLQFDKYDIINKFPEIGFPIEFVDSTSIFSE